MHKYLDELEKKIGKTPAGRFLFNKYYSIKDLYWTILYTTAFGILTCTSELGIIFKTLISIL